MSELLSKRRAARDVLEGLCCRTCLYIQSIYRCCGEFNPLVLHTASKNKPLGEIESNACVITQYTFETPLFVRVASKFLLFFESLALFCELPFRGLVSALSSLARQRVFLGNRARPNPRTVIYKYQALYHGVKRSCAHGRERVVGTALPSRRKLQLAPS